MKLNLARETKTRQSGQILVITLFVLMVVAIIVVGVTAVANRDVLQTVNNQRYNELYDSAERSILNIIDSYGDPAVPLVNLTNSSQVPTGYTCLNDASVAGQYRCRRTETGKTNILLVRESNEIVDFELNKDDSFLMGLSDYRGELQFSWTGTAALEFSLVYYNTATGTYGNINDLFDINNPPIFVSNGGDPIVDSQNLHPFPFLTNTAGGYRFTLGNVVGITSGMRLDYLRITPRMSGTAGSILLTVRPSVTGLPNQVRIFQGLSWGSDDTRILAQAQAQVPLTPQIISPFYYSFLTNSVINK